MASGDTSVDQLLEMKQRLQHQLHQQNVQLAAAGVSIPRDHDPEKITERIEKLQNELLKVTNEVNQSELALERIQIGSVMLDALFATKERETNPLSQETVQLVTDRNELASAILKSQKTLANLNESLAVLLKRKADLACENRELMLTIEQMEEAERSQKILSSSENLKRETARVEGLLNKVTLLRHTFQSLIVASGVNWAQDPELSKLLISLGQPLSTVLKRDAST